MKILANDVTPADAPFIISKLIQDTEKHGYKIKGAGDLYVVFWGENNWLSKISYDLNSRQIIEVQLKGVRLWLDYEQ